jgi:hypothetical protein
MVLGRSVNTVGVLSYSVLPCQYTPLLVGYYFLNYNGSVALAYSDSELIQKQGTVYRHLPGLLGRGGGGRLIARFAVIQDNK